MGTFEQYPWLLIPIIIVTVEAWNLLKAWIRRRFLEKRAAYK
jgi:hypothetical protein